VASCECYGLVKHELEAFLQALPLPRGPRPRRGGS
jgi:hypothetical protein